jgi:hypothetical protein
MGRKRPAGKASLNSLDGMTIINHPALPQWLQTLEYNDQDGSVLQRPPTNAVGTCPVAVFGTQIQLAAKNNSCYLVNQVLETLVTHTQVINIPGKSQDYFTNYNRIRTGRTHKPRRQGARNISLQ